jgi:hypothetical protein
VGDYWPYWLEILITNNWLNCYRMKITNYVVERLCRKLIEVWFMVILKKVPNAMTIARNYGYLWCLISSGEN